MNRSTPTIQQVRTAAIKPELPFWLTTIFYHPVSVFWVWLLARMGLTANGATILSGGVKLTAALCFLVSERWALIAAAVLIQVYFVLDHVDGNLARFERARGDDRAGMSGAFLDTCMHAAAPAVVIAVGWRLGAEFGYPTWLAVGLVLFLFPGSINPWQRNCEVLIRFAGDRGGSDTASIPVDHLRPSSLSLSSPDETESTGRPVRVDPRRWLRQQFMMTIGFPGYLPALSICAVLDAFAQVPSLKVGGVDVPWLLIWLVWRITHAVLAALKSTASYTRRLRALPSGSPEAVTMESP